MLLDDMVDTAGTLTTGANEVHKRGAKSVSACCTHAVLSGPAIDRINHSSLTELVVTNTIPAKSSEKIKIISIADLFAEAIKRIHLNDSVSSLFN